MEESKTQACSCGPDSCEIDCGGEPIACSLDGRDRVFRLADTVVWEAKATEGARAVLDELMRLPETLAELGDLDALKHSLGERAGLVFAADSRNTAK